MAGGDPLGDPAIGVSTDIIVASPARPRRTSRTRWTSWRARFDSAYTFQYSPRPGTRAATMPDQVPKEVVQERFDRLIALQGSSRSPGRRPWWGEVEVLVEGAGRKEDSTQSRTRTNRIVHLREPLEPGTFATVR